MCENNTIFVTILLAGHHGGQGSKRYFQVVTVLPPGCIMVNVSMWCLPTTAHKEWCARYYYRNDKESYTFQRQNPFILQHDVYTHIP